MISITQAKIFKYFTKYYNFIKLLTYFITYFNKLLYFSKIEDLFV